VVDRNWRLNMLGFIARWGHNVLLTSMGLLTIAMLAYWLGAR